MISWVCKIFVRASKQENIRYGILQNMMEISLLDNVDGLIQERRNSIATALELRLSCANVSIYPES